MCLDSVACIYPTVLVRAVYYTAVYSTVLSLEVYCTVYAGQSRHWSPFCSGQSSLHAGHLPYCCGQSRRVVYCSESEISTQTLSSYYLTLSWPQLVLRVSMDVLLWFLAYPASLLLLETRCSRAPSDKTHRTDIAIEHLILNTVLFSNTSIMFI